MLDHCNQIFSFNPDYQMSSNYDRQADEEFDFWGGGDARYYENFSGEMEFRGHFEEELDDYSGLWKRSTSRYVRNETSRLLPHNHRYSNISLTSQSQAIAEARKELMERIHDMPESSYELSLKDIVDEQLTLNKVNKENATERTSFHFNTISLCWKTKVKGGNGSKVSPKPSFQGSENQADKEWSIKKLMAGGDSKRSNRTNSSSSSSRTSTSSRNSSLNRSFSPGCWPFFCTKKIKNKRHRGCIF